MDAGAKVMQDGMKATTAFRDFTGNLRESISIVEKDKGKTERRQIGPAGRKGGHAHLLEFGTGMRRTVPAGRQALQVSDEQFAMHTSSSMAPHPFIRPAFDEYRDDALDAIRDELKRRVRP